MTADGDSAEALREEILEQARDQSGEIIGQARDQADKILAAAAAEAQSLRDKLIEKARTEALRRKELIQSTVPVETGRFRVARIESLLESVREEARRRLLSREDLDYREVLITLASLAIGHMSGVSFRAKVAEADRVVLDNGAVEEITHRVGRPGLSVTITSDPTVNGGGVSIEDVDASQIWNNGLVERLDRMWPELRHQIAQRTMLIPAAQS